jgi:uncharacterized protein (TIGR03084 family)
MNTSIAASSESTAEHDVFTDLEAEYDRLDHVFANLSAGEWASPSGVPDWSIADVVSHLALTEEGVIITLRTASSDWTTRDHHLDAGMDRQVREAALTGVQAYDRWHDVRLRSVAALRAADPDVAVRWAAAPLKPRTLATTRLAEHWAHGLDVSGPLGIDYPDTDRLRHIAWLGHSTLPYAFSLVGSEFHPVRTTLTGPSGDTWTYGPADAESSITGSAGVFCRVGAQRLAPSESGLVTSGPHGRVALSVLRNYAA